MTTPIRTRRERSAAVVEDIRESARRLFMSQGFDATGIREIAAGADVNPAIVIRHFGSKEQLFIETVDPSSVWRELLDVPIHELGVRVVRQIVQGRETGLRSFGISVRSSGRPEIRAQLQDSMRTLVAGLIALRIDAPDAELRAHLFVAQLTGLMVALTVYDDQYLLAAPIDSIVEHYGDTLQRTLTGD